MLATLAGPSETQKGSESNARDNNVTNAMESKHKVYEIPTKESKRGLDSKCVPYVLKIEVGLNS